MTARSLAAALVVATFAAPASAQISTNPKVLAPFKAVVAKATDSTVRVRGDDKDIALGTIVFTDGFILTKYSELKGLLSVRLSDGTEYEATIHGVDNNTDLALLKVDVKNLKAVAFADSKKIPAGHWLAAAGPTSDAMAVGIVSVQTRPLTGFEDTLKSNHNRGFLGVYPEDAKDSDGKVIGARITSVSPKGAAEKAGLKKNDIILEINGIAVPGHDAMREQLDRTRPSEVIKLKVRREGEAKDLDVQATLTGQTEKSRGDIQNAMGGELSGRRGGFPAVLQTDMVVEPKNCGGPIVDLDGNVLGISIARAGRVETWILPSENIRPLLSDLKSGKLAPTTAVAPAPKAKN